MEFNELNLGCAFLVGIATNLLGKRLAERCPRSPRLLWWLGILLPFIVVHILLLGEPAFARMVGLCTVLLLAMKTLTYMEWLKAEGSTIPMQRWLAFSFLWFGMQPKAWVGKRRKQEWVSHLQVGLLCMVLGAVGFSVYVFFEGNYFPLSFILLSLMFHYGVLRLNTAFWRAMGFPVRTLFKNPLKIHSFREFWGAKWNLGYSQMMARAVQRPLLPKLGPKGAIFAVFLVSGLFHEFAITVPTMKGFGGPFLFFVGHGVAVFLEKKPHRFLGLLCLASLVLGLPFLFPAEFVTGIIEPVENLWQLWFNLL